MGKKRRIVSGVLTAAVCMGILAPTNIYAEGYTGWREESGGKYWYENDVKQGTTGRGKEIYDPASDAWYWLDAVDGGKMAVSKDVYQESDAGMWGDYTNEAGVQCGKWVRYDANGHMVKGWSVNAKGTYYFDQTFGTMAKGTAVLDGIEYQFDWITGILLESSGRVPGNANGWYTIDGEDYWYENGIRQGMQGRGKEIYDPASNAWYWLDAVDGGKMAVDKDVYQESLAGDWGDTIGVNGELYGKWVRYDKNGHMVKGWNEKDGKQYFFDYTYGTMAKGYAAIDGKVYYFDEATGVLQGEVEVKELEWRSVESVTYNNDGTIRARNVSSYDGANRTRRVNYQGNKAAIDAEGYPTYYYSVSSSELIPAYEYLYEYDANGNRIKNSYKDYTRVAADGKNGEYTSYLSMEYTYTYKNGVRNTYTRYRYDKSGNIEDKTEVFYDGKGNAVKECYYNGNGLQLYATFVYEYGSNGKLVKAIHDYASENTADQVTKYEYDASGNLLKETVSVNNVAEYETTYQYKNGKVVSCETENLAKGYIKSRTVNEYDEAGNCIEEKQYVYCGDAYGLQLEQRTTWQYDANGNETLENCYYSEFDGEGKWVEKQYAYAVTTYTRPKGYQVDAVESFDSYYGHYTVNADGTVTFALYGDGDWAYDYGYAYDYGDNGGVKTYYSYTSDKQYKRTLESRTEYKNYTLGKADVPGEREEHELSVTYDKAGNRMYYTVEIWEAYGEY